MRDDVKKWTVEELKKELTRLLGFTAENLSMMAVVVDELERRGENLKSLRMGLLPLLRLIAKGVLAPDIVVMYAGQRNLIWKIAKLPMDEQIAIASGEKEPPENPPKKHLANEKRISTFIKPTSISKVEGINQQVNGSAEKGTPKDVADLSFRLIMKSASPEWTMKHLFDLLTINGIASGNLMKEMRLYDPAKV